MATEMHVDHIDYMRSRAAVFSVISSVVVKGVYNVYVV